jgi:hypothetical protein
MVEKQRRSLIATNERIANAEVQPGQARLSVPTSSFHYYCNAHSPLNSCPASATLSSPRTMYSNAPTSVPQ